MRSISAGKFKDRCLRILDEVAANRTPVTITKWGRPVARLLPVIAPSAARGDETPQADAVRESAAPYGAPTNEGRSEAAGSRLQRLAAELGLSPERLLHEALDAYGGDSALDELIERAKRPVGAFRSTDPDLAQDHDEAFVQILEEEMARRRLPK